MKLNPNHSTQPQIFENGDYEHPWYKHTSKSPIMEWRDERDRLIKLYENFDSSFTNEIDIIILKKNSIIESNAVIDKKRFCQLNTTKVFNIYINSKKMKCY